MQDGGVQRGEPTVLGLRIAVLGTGGAPGSLRQGSPEPAVAPCGLSALSLSSALVVAWADAGPRGEVGVGGKARHVHPDLGYQYFGGIPEWKNPSGVFPSRSPISVSKSKDDWVFAADATARLTGVPGVAAVTAGPGATNTITAVKNAQLAQSPVVLLVGGTATATRGAPAIVGQREAQQRETQSVGQHRGG